MLFHLKSDHVVSELIGSGLSDHVVVELGAGKSGLAGIGLAALNKFDSALITDGNEEAVKILSKNIDLNQDLFKLTKVSY